MMKLMRLTHCPSAHVECFYHRGRSPSSAVALLRRVEGPRDAIAAAFLFFSSVFPVQHARQSLKTIPDNVTSVCICF